MTDEITDLKKPKQTDATPARWASGFAPLLPFAQFSEWEPWVRLAMVVAISIALLSTGIYLIVSEKAKPQNQKWGYSFVSMVTGFWFGRGI